jgi:RNA polymerase sigma-70 factor (ECF subfamily)
MLIVLESLSPLERAAFVLTEVFGMSAPEVGEALDRSPAAVRRLVHRARSHVEARRPRESSAPRATARSPNGSWPSRAVAT